MYFILKSSARLVHPTLTKIFHRTEYLLLLQLVIWSLNFNVSGNIFTNIFSILLTDSAYDIVYVLINNNNEKKFDNK